jgi:tRNA 2-thiouridine synthesizing protein A
MADKTLDTRGLTCPLPILKTKKAIGSVPVGGTLEVLATDPGSREDFAVFARTTGHDLIEDGEDGGVFRFVLRRAR